MMARRWSVLIVAGIGALSAAGYWLTRPRPVDAMPVVLRSLRACSLVDHIARQTTIVYAGTRPVRTEVEISYRNPCLRRMVFLTPPLKGVTILDDGERTVRLDPDPKRARVVVGRTSDAPERMAERRALLERNYRARMTGEETIAGRRAYRIELRSRHPGNPWKRLWVDKETKILLASEDYDGAGRRTRESRVERISFEREPKGSLRPSAELVKRAKREPAEETEIMPPSEISKAVGFTVLQPSYIPAGYELEAAFVYSCQCGCSVPAARLQYGDGLNTISILQCGHLCHHESACGPRGLPQGEGVRVVAGENTIVAVGELVRGELEKMAKSIPGAAFVPAPGMEAQAR
jgi:outer membrane lipoprotein-sorting protein